MNRLRSQRGFTLIEALVAFFIGTIALLGLYGLVDASNKLTKQETDVADAQDSVRVGLSALTRVIRQARVGALYFGSAILPTVNNSPGGQSLTDLAGSSHFIRKGTDVITVRGVILGDHYSFSPTDVTCAGPCDGSTAMTVTIEATTPVGIVNFPSGGVPFLANNTVPFFFVVQDGTNQVVTVGGSSYLVPLYFVGRVDTTGTWYTKTANTFTFTMKPQDADARKLDAPATGTPVLSIPVAGGAVDEIAFFVDEGQSDATGSRADTHPSLAQAILDPASGAYNVQTLVEEVEDFQVAYGIEGIDGLPRDGGVSPTKVDTSGINKDEWVGNVANEVETTLPISSTEPKHVDAFIDTSVAAGPSNPLPASSALRSVWVSLVVKSANPDLVYDGPGARGRKILDSTAVSFSDPAATARPYRRRALSLAVSLRNYE
jgi:Tfp pilus assembly protein PilW